MNHNLFLRDKSGQGCVHSISISGNYLKALKRLYAAAKRLVIIRALACGISQRMLTLTASQSAGARHDVAIDGRKTL